MAASERRLLVSIHDVGPRLEAEVDALAEQLDALLGGPHFAMLVVPDHWDAAPLSAAPAYRAKLRAWPDAGVEVFLHDWCHRDDSAHTGGMAGFKAKHLTAGEGEFLGLGHDEALRRMRRGRAVVEDAIGRSVAGFIAPAWLYGPGARSAMAEGGFAIAEDHLRIWRPANRAILARGPVITWASRSPARMMSSLSFAALARHALGAMATVRVAVHPGDTRAPALLRSIDRTVRALSRHRQPSRYRDLPDR